MRKKFLLKKIGGVSESFVVCAFVNRERCNNSIYLVYMCAYVRARAYVRALMNEAQKIGAKNIFEKSCKIFW